MYGRFVTVQFSQSTICDHGLVQHVCRTRSLTFKAITSMTLATVLVGAISGAIQGWKVRVHAEAEAVGLDVLQPMGSICATTMLTMTGNMARSSMVTTLTSVS